MMKKRILRFVAFALLVSGCNFPTIAPRVGTTESPTAEPDQPCYYNWAYKDLPELSAELEALIQAIDPKVTAYASAYGEDCISEDGASVFGALETDFYFQIPVKDLSDLEGFGEWIVQAMGIIDELPSEMIEGPQDGFAQIKFEKNKDEFLFVRVPIRDYRERAAGLSGAELFQMYYLQP